MRTTETAQARRRHPLRLVDARHPDVPVSVFGVVGEESSNTDTGPREGESGKVGLAVLMWFLGVPGLLVLA
jgi:hypothetical protein